MNPYVLVAIALVFSHGYFYVKGKRAAYREQAAAVLAINNQIAEWRLKYEAAERKADERLDAATNVATEILNAQLPDDRCRLNDDLARALIQISGD